MPEVNPIDIRIAILSTHSSPLGRAGSRDTGGMSTYLRDLSLALGKIGCQVDLYTRSGTGGESGSSIYDLSSKVRLIELDDRLGTLSKIDIYPQRETIAEQLDHFASSNQFSYHIIFSHYWISGSVGRILQQKWNVPHLIMFHTLGAAKNAACPDENEPAVRITEEKLLTRQCSLVIAPTLLEKEKLVRYCNAEPDRIAVIPCGVDCRLFRPEHRDENKNFTECKLPKTVLYAGRIEPVKGIDLLIKSTALLPPQDNIKLVIVGGDSVSSGQIIALQKLTRLLGIEDRVIFKGLVEHHQMPLVYRNAAATVLPSYYESFGLVALESIACGTPLVAAPVGVVPELFKTSADHKFGFMVENRDPAVWAAKITEMINRNNEIPCSEIETKLKPFRWPEIATAMVKQFHSLLGRPGVI